MTDGEGPVTPEEAKARVEGWYERNEHKARVNDPREKATKEDALDDPAHHKED